jgi:hypothetical protein
MWLVLLRIILALSLVLPPTNLRIRETGPMAVEFISDFEFEGDEAQAGYESSITIPADTTAIVVGAALELNAGGDPTFTALNWDSSGLDFTLAVKENGDTYGSSGTVLYVLTSDDTGWPGTGSGKTLYWTQSHNIAQAPQIWVGFFKGVDTADPIGATTWSDGSYDDYSSVSHTSSLGTVDAADMSIMASYYWYDGNTPTNAGSGQTLFANMSGDFQSLFVVGELGESSLNVTGLDYPITAAFVLQAAAAGGTTEVDIAGAMGFAGAVTRKFVGARSAAGVLSYGGTVSRFQRLKRSFLSDLTFSGSASSVSKAIYQVAVAGVLALAGEVARKTSQARSIAGALTSNATLERLFRPKRSASGALSTSGDLSRLARAKRTISAAVSFVGATTHSYVQSVANAISGAIGFAGALTRKVFRKRSVSSQIDFSGEGERSKAEFKRDTDGVLDFRGASTSPSITTALKRGLMRLGKALNFR